MLDILLAIREDHLALGGIGTESAASNIESTAPSAMQTPCYAYARYDDVDMHMQSPTVHASTAFSVILPLLQVLPGMYLDLPRACQILLVSACPLGRGSGSRSGLDQW